MTLTTPFGIAGNGITISALNLNLLPTGRNENSKAAYLSIYWKAVHDATGGFYAVINLLQQYQTGNFTTVQAVWIDNSTAPYEFVLNCLETTQTIRVAPFTMGMFPIFASTSPTFGATLNGLADPVYGLLNTDCTTEIFFLNTPQRYVVIPQPTYGQNWSQYTYGKVVNVAGAVPLVGITGNGLQNIGYPFYYTITSCSVTIMLTTALTANWSTGFQLQEISSGPPFIRYDERHYSLSGALGVVYRSTWNFPNPMLQIDVNSGWNFQSTVMPTNAGAGFNMTININYGSLQIS